MLNVMLASAAAIACLMLAIWLLSLWKRDASIVDIGWGIGFVLVAWTAYCIADRDSADWLLPVLTTLWGVRLSGYLFWRNHGQPEDYRYREMRAKWGSAFAWISLLTVFGLQGVVMFVVALPIQIGTALADRNLVWLKVVGVIVWAAGLCFESMGDWQLARFKADPGNKGQVLDSGLWRYTRHPNYFGDFLVWWGLFLVSLSLTAVWWTIIAPLLMSLLLMRVSGVTLLETKLSTSKPGYAEYVARTNAFFPGPVKTTASV
ncbi:DUF1295 domain-containing protein [Rosistilla oblonga]|uniref:DUF1295 domain-containing protein n=1 Tax=Rosistilla oblonga TaxID=2527990 RepID=UPI003A985D25